LDLSTVSRSIYLANLSRILSLQAKSNRYKDTLFYHLPFIQNKVHNFYGRSRFAIGAIAAPTPEEASGGKCKRM
jgi:superfamily II DNA/RNA helicase